jgi:hypothetical protein
MTVTKARQELAEMRNRAARRESRACTVQTKVAMFQRLYGHESDHMYL